MNMVKETYDYGELPYTLRKAIVTIIYKKGDETLLKNYRPISLTNYDYKIIASVFARRLQKVISKIVDEDQSGYIKGRFIGCNARMLEDIFEYCESGQKNGVIVCLLYTSPSPRDS